MSIRIKEKNSNCAFNLKFFEDNVYEPLRSNDQLLSSCIEKVLSAVVQRNSFSIELDDVWAKSGYSPTPTIVEAAVALYERNTVEDITKHGGDIDKTSAELRKIIDYCRDNKRKAPSDGLLYYK